MGLAPYGNYIKCQGCLDTQYPVFSNGKLLEPRDYKNKFSSILLKSAFHWHSELALKIQEIIAKYGKADVADEAQRILEENVMNFVLPWLEKEQTFNLATAGGVFLNVKLNQRLWMSGKIKNHYPYPNPGDSSLGLGAALYACSINGIGVEPIDNLYYGPEYSNDDIKKILDNRFLDYKYYEDIQEKTAQCLSNRLVSGKNGMWSARVGK